MGYLVGGIIVIIIAAVLLFAGMMLKEDAPGGTLACVITAFIALVIGGWCIWAQYNTASGERQVKDHRSEISGGLQRTVEVYDNYGHLLHSYEGKLDVKTNDAGNKVLFDLDGKRTVIYGAIVIVQEK